MYRAFSGRVIQQVLGIDVHSIEILLKKNFLLALESATVAIGDREHLGEGWIDREKSAIQSGKLIFFSTGANGVYRLQIRVVNAPEPILSPREYNRVGQVAGPYNLSVPSGEIAFSDFCCKEGAKTFKIIPGNYKVTIFVYHIKDDFSYYICFAPTTDSAQNQLNDNSVPVLEI